MLSTTWPNATATTSRPDAGGRSSCLQQTLLQPSRFIVVAWRAVYPRKQVSTSNNSLHGIDRVQMVHRFVLRVVSLSFDPRSVTVGKEPLFVDVFSLSFSLSLLETGTPQWVCGSFRLEFVPAANRRRRRRRRSTFSEKNKKIRFCSRVSPCGLALGCVVGSLLKVLPSHGYVHRGSHSIEKCVRCRLVEPETNETMNLERQSRRKQSIPLLSSIVLKKSHESIRKEVI